MVLPSQKRSFDLGVLGVEEIFFSHLSFSMNKKNPRKASSLTLLIFQSCSCWRFLEDAFMF